MGNPKKKNTEERHDPADAEDTNINYLPGQVPVTIGGPLGEERQPDPLAAEIAVNPKDLKGETEPASETDEVTPDARPAELKRDWLKRAPR